MQTPDSSERDAQGLQAQVLATLRYFDVQDHAVTALEIWKYLLVGDSVKNSAPLPVLVDQVFGALDGLCSRGDLETANGFYFLPGRSALVESRLRNNFYATPRLKRAHRWLAHVRHLPFIQAVALTGSEATNSSKRGSDIDLLVITEPGRMWLGRLAITVYFQAIGLRRHGDKVADRFCLNHYVAGARRLGHDHNIYTAVEYVSLVPYFGAEKIRQFQDRNLDWVRTYLAQPALVRYVTPQKSWAAFAVEKIFANKFGSWLDARAGKLQSRRIRLQNYITVAEDELSFHPGSKGQQVLSRLTAAGR